jgi:hypothetical protein
MRGFTDPYGSTKLRGFTDPYGSTQLPHRIGGPCSLLIF